MSTQVLAGADLVTKKLPPLSWCSSVKGHYVGSWFWLKVLSQRRERGFGIGLVRHRLSCMGATGGTEVSGNK